MEKNAKSSVVGIALRLFVICFVATLILSAVNMLTKDTIKENNARKFMISCQTVMPSASEFEMVDVKEFADKLGVSECEAALAYDEEKNVIGLCVKQSVKGYNSGLVFMTGLSSDGEKVTGIEVLEHSETPSLGAEVTTPRFKSQFEGEKLPVSLKKHGGEIDAITGATKTSDGIVRGIGLASMLAEEYFLRGDLT